MTDNEKMVILRSVVGGFCVKGMSFTSVEIANHMKRLGVWIRNRVVAKFIRENTLNIAAEYGVDYNIAQISVDNGHNCGMCNCYHVSHFHPNDYLSRDLRAITPDEFESMHGFDPFHNEHQAEEEMPKKKSSDSGRISFNFPCSK